MLGALGVAAPDALMQDCVPLLCVCWTCSHERRWQDFAQGLVAADCVDRGRAPRDRDSGCRRQGMQPGSATSTRA